MRFMNQILYHFVEVRGFWNLSPLLCEHFICVGYSTLSLEVVTRRNELYKSNIDTINYCERNLSLQSYVHDSVLFNHLL